jgi:hypothetical protein
MGNPAVAFDSGRASLAEEPSGLATPSPDRLLTHLLDFGRGAARCIGESKEGWLVRQAVRPGVRCRDIRVPEPCSAPLGVDQASMSSRLRAAEDLGGEQSPWKDRALSDLQRSGNVTDSSVEQSLEVGRSSGDLSGRRRPRGLRSRSWKRPARVVDHESNGGRLPPRWGVAGRRVTGVHCCSTGHPVDLDSVVAARRRSTHQGDESSEPACGGRLV